jgi:hypothetical protein
LLLLLGTLHSNTSDPSLTLQDSSTVNVSTVDVDNIRTQSRELAAASLGGQLTDTDTGDVPLSTSAGSSELNNKPSDGVTGESTKPSASGSSGPLGLGGGLQPKVLNNDSLVFTIQSYSLTNYLVQLAFFSFR